MKLIVALATAALAGAATTEPVRDWGESKDEISSSPDFDRSKALCRHVRDREPPAADRPDAAAARSLQGCGSEALYYGIGMKADPKKARQCAFLEAERPEGAGPFSGRAMLMTIYANGVGARRDLDVATHLACGVDGAPMESHGRVLRLSQLKAEGWTGSDFHYCDEITSGYAGGLCARHFADIRSVKREAELSALTRGWTPRERSAFASLKVAQAAFAEAHAGGEVDMSGTLRSAFWIQAQESLAEDFAELLKALEGGRGPTFSAAEARKADSALNAGYRRTLSAMGSEGYGTVTREGVVAAQRAWLRYRDAFLAFAAVRYPRTPRHSLLAALTHRRTEMFSAR
jgi:hypothetical protein